MTDSRELVAAIETMLSGNVGEVRADRLRDAQDLLVDLDESLRTFSQMASVILPLVARIFAQLAEETKSVGSPLGDDAPEERYKMICECVHRYFQMREGLRMLEEATSLFFNENSPRVASNLLESYMDVFGFTEPEWMPSGGDTGLEVGEDIPF